MLTAGAWPTVTRAAIDELLATGSTPAFEFTSACVPEGDDVRAIDLVVADVVGAPLETPSPSGCRVSAAVPVNDWLELDEDSVFTTARVSAAAPV
jgi:hypothetical protein